VRLLKVAYGNISHHARKLKIPSSNVEKVLQGQLKLNGYKIQMFKTL
jgi:hypothetical protein